MRHFLRYHGCFNYSTHTRDSEITSKNNFYKERYFIRFNINSIFDAETNIRNVVVNRFTKIQIILSYIKKYNNLVIKSILTMVINKS